MSKKFLYLVQTEGALPVTYSNLKDDGADVICLSWRDKVNGNLYLPGSTWTEGRNRLLVEARESGNEYLYYIFLDDDLAFARGSWRQMEEMLLKFEPAIGVPDFRANGKRCHWRDNSSGVRFVHSHDALFSAVHRDVVKDGLILPYFAGFDHLTWWASQLVFIHLARYFYPSAVLRFSDIAVRNSKHRKYPRLPSGQSCKECFAVIEKWILEPGNVFTDVCDFQSTFVPHFESLGINGEPAGKNGTHFTNVERRRLLSPTFFESMRSKVESIVMD